MELNEDEIAKDDIPLPLIDSWTIHITIEELNLTMSMVVKESTIITTIKLYVIEHLNLKYDFTDFDLYDSVNKIWLLPDFTNIASYSLYVGSKLLFLRRYRILNVQLPDLQIRPMLLDFTKSIFDLNQTICKRLGIRHYEELSLQAKPAEVYSNSLSLRISRTWNSLKKLPSISSVSLLTTLNRSQRRATSLKKNMSYNSTISKQHSFKKQHLLSQNTPSVVFSDCNDEIESVFFDSFQDSVLAKSLCKSHEEALEEDSMCIYTTWKERCELGYRWLASDRNLLQQDIEDLDNCLLLLRFKYHSYLSLNERYDEIRINQIFHQIRWSILSGETACTEQEYFALGGILLQIMKKGDEIFASKDIFGSKDNLNQEISTMLDKITLDLIGKINCEENPEDVKIMEINGPILLKRYPKCYLSGYTAYLAEMGSRGIDIFNTETLDYIETVPVKGNSIDYKLSFIDVNKTYLEIVLLPFNDANKEFSMRKSDKIRIKFQSKQDLIKWVVGCKLVSKGLDFRNPSNYQLEYHVITQFINMQYPENVDQASIVISEDDDLIDLNDVITDKIIKKFKRRFILEQLIVFRNCFSHLSCLEAKLAYIKFWLTLSSSGMKYFLVTVNKVSKNFAIGLGYNRLELVNCVTGKLKQLWHMNSLISWVTNWENRHILLNFKDEEVALNFNDDSNCQQFHEYLGGYLFIMLRNSENAFDLSKHTFMKLTSRKL